MTDGSCVPAVRARRVEAMPRRWYWPFGRDAEPVNHTDAADSRALLAPSPHGLVGPPSAAAEERARRGAERQRRADWANPATGMGMAGVDPALATYYLANNGISDEEAVDLHRTDPIAAKLINKPVDTAFEKGFELEVAEDDAARNSQGQRQGTDARPAQRLKADVEARWRALDVFKVLRKAWKHARREGGAAILLGAADVGAVQGMTAPLAPEGYVDLRWLRVLRARDLWPATYYADPSAPKFDEPETWNVTMMGRNGGLAGVPMMRVHESRLIIFEGEKVVDEAYRGQLHPGFGDSVLLRFYRALRRYGTTMAGVEKLLSRFGQPHMKIARLAELMGSDKAGDLNTLLDAYEYAASVFNVRVLDSEDSYGTDAPTVTGLPELLNQVRGELQAAADMPLPILFGDVIGGLGDNSVGVMRAWLDSVAALRDEHAIPPLTRITELIIRGLGTGNLPGDWKVKGCALWHPTAKEQAEVDLIEMQIDTGYLAGTVVTPLQVMRRHEVAERFAIDLAALDQLEAAPLPDDIRTPQAPPPDPGAPAAAPTGDVQKTALNGAQVAALLEIIKAVAAGDIARESAVEAVILAFPGTDAAQAERLLGPADWKPEAKPVPPALAPFADPPGPAGAPPKGTP